MMNPVLQYKVGASFSFHTSSQENTANSDWVLPVPDTVHPQPASAPHWHHEVNIIQPPTSWGGQNSSLTMREPGNWDPCLFEFQSPSSLRKRSCQLKAKCLEQAQEKDFPSCLSKKHPVLTPSLVSHVYKYIIIDSPRMKVTQMTSVSLVGRWKTQDAK